MLKQILAAILLTAIAACALARDGVRGTWAASGVPLENRGEAARWVSADHMASVEVTSSSSFLTVGNSKEDLTSLISSPRLVEIGWSSSHRRVFINASDAGAMGEWHSRAFLRVGESMKVIPIDRLVAESSPSRAATCISRNVSAIGWVDSTNDLLVMESLPNSSSCGADMDRATFYLIDLNKGGVREIVSASVVQKKYWALLGAETRRILLENLSRSS